MLQLFRSVSTKARALLAACVLALSTFAMPAMAGGGGGVDVSAVVSAIQGAAAPIGSIGAAVLIVLVAIKVYKWVRRAM